ncbi:MAG: DUF5947 family protein [Acidobacteriota bacterium]
MHISQRHNPFTTLRRLMRESAPLERCELCNTELSAEHQHLLEPASRKLVCACEACAILFSNPDSKFRRVPKRIGYLSDFLLTDGQWESLMIPINMAFFFRSTIANRVLAFYPSPAGPTESLLTLEAWQEIVAQNPILQTMEADVEALLINRLGRERQFAAAQYYLVPIDQCYKLTGLIRAHWRGLSGGTLVWDEIRDFFDDLQNRAISIKEPVRA